jgi:hypothetical protein
VQAGGQEGDGGTDLLELEATIKRVPGVLGCVILATGEGDLGEIQAFTRAGEDRARIQESIRGAVSKAGFQEARAVQVFELEAESHLGDRETLRRAAELAEQDARSRGGADVSRRMPGAPGPRPALARVVLSSSSGKSEAEVALGSGSRESVGLAEGEKTSHGLRVVAQATLDACEQLVAGVAFDLKGVSLVTTLGREAVLVLAQSGDRPETVGAALVREGPTSEATVRATLDAVNRRLAQG